jgi:hypothetical protein
MAEEKLVASRLISSFLHPCNEGPQSIYMIENDLHCSRNRNSEDHAHRTPDRAPHNTGDIVALIVVRQILCFSLEKISTVG